jgi:hypothetical protein
MPARGRRHVSPAADAQEERGHDGPEAPRSSPSRAGEFPRELGSSRGEALQGCLCWRSPRGFSTRATVDSGIANE